jgi:hypothetical protein
VNSIDSILNLYQQDLGVDFNINQQLCISSPPPEIRTDRSLWRLETLSKMFDSQTDFAGLYLYDITGAENLDGFVSSMSQFPTLESLEPVIIPEFLGDRSDYPQTHPSVDLLTVVVSSAGNDDWFSPKYPAGYATDWGIAVGASNINNQFADFSNYAGYTPLDYVVAPGVEVYSTIPYNGYSLADGTSMAAPHVAGIAALMLSANPNLTVGEVEQILTQTANPDVLIA